MSLGLSALGLVALGLSGAAPLSPITGATAVQLGSVVGTGSGVAAISGQGAAALGSVTSAAAGSTAITGAASSALGSVSSDASGAAAISGAGAIGLQPITGTASGAVESPQAAITGAASAALGTVSGAASGSVDVRGLSSCALGAILTASTGTNEAPQAMATEPHSVIAARTRRLAVAAQPRRVVIAATKVRTMTPLKFDPKDPAEALVLGFDFAKLTSAPSAPAVTVARYSGEADDAPEAMLDGAATVQGTRVLQRIVGGVPGCTYSLRAECDGDGDGQHWVLAGLLEVKEAP